MEIEQIMELLASKIRKEALKIKESRLQNLVYKIEELMENLDSENPQLEEELSKAANQLALMEAEGSQVEPDDVDVAVVIDKVVGWMWVDPECIQKAD